MPDGKSLEKLCKFVTVVLTKWTDLKLSNHKLSIFVKDTKLKACMLLGQS